MNRKYCERWLKSCLKKKVSITATTIIMFLMTGLIVNTPIFASVLIGNTDGAPITPNGSVVSSWGITIGGGITNAGSHSVHVGDASLEEGERNVIIGTHATAGVNGGSRQFVRQSVAIGVGGSANEGARAFGDQSIAIGANTVAEGNSSIAIGNDDVDRTNTITTKYTNLKGETTTGTIGDAYNALTGKSLMDDGQYRDTKSKEAAVAIGVKALAGNISLALGTASSADVVNGVAIGTGATVTRDNAIAIGGGATTEKEGTKETDVTVNGIHYTWKGGENTIAGDVVSFGKEGYERQLKHVAAGKVSKDSTDAINGSQLHGVLEHITSEPVYFYAGDNSISGKITGTTAEAKNADAKAKNIVARSMSNHRLNILGGATGDLSNNNIGVNYENDSTLRVKLAKELKDLKSAEFKNDAGDKTTINSDGVTITPNGNTDSNKNVSVTKDGLNNGGNVIANVGGNLDGAKTGTTVPTTNATVPNNVDGIKNNAATVGDVLQAGWNLQERGVAKDFVKPYDTVNFVDGKGTTVVVNTEADRSTSTIKYDVNLGKGLQKDDTTNEITVKADEKSLTVGTDGVKAKTDNKTITTGDNGLKVVTGGIEAGTTPGTVKVKEDDTGKIATVDSVVNAVNNAAFTLKASAGDGTRNGNSTVNANGESIKAGNTIEMIAGKNLDVKHDGNGKITFATVENPSFDTVQVGNSEGPKFSATTEGNISVSDKEGTNPVKITNVKDGKISANSKDAINGSQFHKVANNTIKLAGQNGEEEATETDPQNLNKQGGIKFTVKSSNGDLLEVTAAEDTVTLTPKTAKITTGTDGVPTANTTDGKLVTADDLVTALKKMGWKATAGNDGTGTVEGNAEELIKAGETVTFKAGDNLKIKQDGKNFIYSLNTALSGLTSAEFKDGDNKVKITPTGITITKPAGTTENTVTLNQNGLNNGGNPITNVTSNLVNYSDPDVNGKAPVRNQLRNFDNNAVPDTNVATVGDLRNMGWVVSSNKTTGDLGNPYSETVKNADEVKFVGTGLATVSGKTENGVRTITVDVESKTAINAVTYTKKDGTKVYPVEGPTGTTYHTTPEGKGPNDETVDGSNVITSVNGPKGTQTPSTLSNVEGNLVGAKTGTDAPTTSATAPTLGTETNQVNKNNAATVGDVLQAGWNLQNNGTAKDFVKPYDTVNFIDGDGTTAVVETTENETSTVKYSVNVGNGLEKNNSNQITVKPADSSLVVDAAGVKVNTGTINNVTTGDKAGAVAANTDDDNKVATVGNVVNAINNAAWTATSAKTEGGELGKDATNQLVKAGDKVTFEADKNIKITQDGSKFTFATKDNVTFNTVQVGGDQGPKLAKTDDGNIKVSDKDGTEPVKITNVKDGDISKDSKDAINGSQFHKLANNTIQLKGQTGTNTATETNKQALNKENGIAFTIKSSDGSLLEVNAAEDTITLTPKTATLTTTDGVPTATTTNGKLVTADQLVTALTEMGWNATAGKDGTGAVTGTATELIKAGNTVTFKAGDNLAIKQDGKEFIYSLKPVLSGLTSAEFKDGNNNKVNITPTGITITKPADPVTGTPENTVTLNQNGLNNGGNPITNVTSNLVNYSDPDVNGKAPVRNELRNFNNDAVPDTNVATVGDLRNMGWIVSADKITDDLTTNAYTDTVKNADEVKFVGTGTATVSGKTVDGVRTITVEVNDQVSTNNSVTPVVYTKADGTKVYPKEVKNPDGTKEVKFYPNPDGTGTEIPKEEVITSVNGPDGTKNPTTLKNIAGNLEGAKTGTQAPTTNAAAPTNVDSIKNNAATVGDVLNAGWNLQNNGTEKDFVRPYDTVNFIDGLNTKAIVTTDKDGKVSNVQIDVKDLPIAYTNEAGDKVVKAADGKYYKESDLAGKVYDPKTNTFKNADGAATAQPTEVAKDNIKTNLVNPNAAADKTATTDPSILGNVKSGLDTIKEADNKAAAGLVNLNDKDDAGNYKVSDNNVATVGDLRNMGWVVSSDKTTGNLGTAYNDQVRNANEVKFVGKGTATVSGKTEGNVRTITVEVNDQVSTNNSVTPVVYTKADGTKVYPIKQADGTTKFFEKPDGTGTEILKGDVITSVNGPDGTKNPTTLKNIAGNLEGAKTGTQAPTTNAAAPTNVDSIKNNAATVGDVLNAGWNLQNNGTEKDFVKPYDTVNFVDGLNTKAIVTTDAAGKVSNIQIDVKDLPIAYTNEAGDKVVKAADGKYYKESDLAGKVYDPKTNTFKNADGAATAQPTEVAKDNIKTNLVNPNAAADKTATTDPSILGNVKSGLDTIKEADNKAAAGLVNLNDKDDAGNYKVSDNNVATVGDLRNMGWVVSASDNGYTNTVKNANKVDFKGGNGIEVTGKTTADGTREITVAIKEGAVTNNVKVTKEDGTVIEAIRDKDGKLYEKDANGKADKTKPVVLTAKDKVENNGSGFVTGNNVATAIQDSGWNLGKAKAKDVNKAFETEAKVHDKVNPNDDVNFVDGDNTTVSMVNVNAENTDGTSKTITYIKTDIKRDINIDSITIGRKNPGGTPNPEKSVTLTDKGLNNGGNNITNVAGNLDGAKTGTTAPTTNAAAPTNVDAIKNNAATVGDVLNAGWNLQNNGTAKDFVKPYDTVNFVDGINTKVTVTTDPDGTKSDVRVDVVGLPIAFADKNGNRLVQGKDPVGNPVYYRMLFDGTVDKTLIIPASDVTVTNVNPVDSKVNTVGTRGGATISGIANGAKTFEAPKDKNGKDLKLGNDGKWYPADSVLINNKYYPAGSVVSKNGNVYPAGTTLDKDGNPTTPGTIPVTEVKSVVKPKNPGKAGLINFGHSNSDTTNAATVGDLQNMGWVVSTSDTGYNDQVRNANVVDFKEGEGIKISGETLENGVRQIKVGIDKNVVATKQELAQVERLSSAGIAGVAAMANIPQINEAASNRYNIAVGVGYHKGEKALAVGISGVSDGGRVVYKASAALDSQKQTTVGLGVGYQFGKRDIEPNELDRFRAQLDLVNTQKSSLAQRLKEETHKVVELNNKVEELEKQNKMLNEKMDLILKKLGGK